MHRQFHFYVIFGKIKLRLIFALFNENFIAAKNKKFLITNLHSLTNTLMNANYLKRKLSNSSVINEILFELTALSLEYTQLVNQIYIKAVIILSRM